jgi:hypothetical protein
VPALLLSCGDTVATRNSEPMMATGKITKRSVDGLIRAGQPVLFFDTDVKGFGVRMLRSGIAS